MQVKIVISGSRPSGFSPVKTRKTRSFLLLLVVFNERSLHAYFARVVSNGNVKCFLQIKTYASIIEPPFYGQEYVDDRREAIAK